MGTTARTPSSSYSEQPLLFGTIPINQILHDDEARNLTYSFATPHIVYELTDRPGLWHGARPDRGASRRWKLHLSQWCHSKGYDFANPTKSLLVRSSATYYVWRVKTNSADSSESYSFRVVDSSGDVAPQKSGGFWSAVFYISGGTTSSSSSSSLPGTSLSAHSTPFSASSTSSSAATIATFSSTSTTFTQTSSTFPSSISPATSSAGLSTGAKIGIGVGSSFGVIGLVGFAVGFYFWRKWQGKKQEPQEMNGPINDMDSKTQRLPYQDHQMFKDTPATPIAELFVPTGRETRPMYEI
ncbi:hypothetical protein SCUP515_04716 [Seiridium cupressi]